MELSSIQSFIIIASLHGTKNKTLLSLNKDFNKILLYFLKGNLSMNIKEKKRRKGICKRRVKLQGNEWESPFFASSPFHRLVKFLMQTVTLILYQRMIDVKTKAWEFLGSNNLA